MKTIRLFTFKHAAWHDTIEYNVCGIFGKWISESKPKINLRIKMKINDSEQSETSNKLLNTINTILG